MIEIGPRLSELIFFTTIPLAVLFTICFMVWVAGKDGTRGKGE